MFPDLALVLRDANDPTRGVIHKLDVTVVVVSFSRAFSKLVRSWAFASPKIEAWIIDADTVPMMTLEQARARPTAAVLVAALHGRRGKIEAARIAIAAIRDLPEQQQERYIPIILAALPKRQRDILSKEIPMRQREDELWALEKQSGTYHVGRQAGLKAGRRAGRRAGRQEEARRRLIQLILTVLKLRNIRVDRSSRSRIRAEKKLTTLERWAAASQQVTQITELFEPA